MSLDRNLGNFCCGYILLSEWVFPSLPAFGQHDHPSCPVPRNGGETAPKSRPPYPAAFWAFLCSNLKNQYFYPLAPERGRLSSSAMQFEAFLELELSISL